MTKQFALTEQLGLDGSQTTAHNNCALYLEVTGDGNSSGTSSHSVAVAVSARLDSVVHLGRQCDNAALAPCFLPEGGEGGE